MVPGKHEFLCCWEGRERPDGSCYSFFFYRREGGGEVGGEGARTLPQLACAWLCALMDY